MEYTPETSKKKHKKHFIRHVQDVCSKCSLSSSSESSIFERKCHKFKKKRLRYSNGSYLTSIFQKRKLKEKSLSKKMKTPLDRKLYRTCWPIKLHKVSKIKKKPEEKKREKPTQKSITRRKFSNPILISKKVVFRDSSPPISCRELEFLDDELFCKVFSYFKKKHYHFEHVTPEMLMNVLKRPEYLEHGATIDMIIKKLRKLKVDLNPSRRKLKEEILEKLLCAIKFGLVVENEGFYRVSDDYITDPRWEARFNHVWTTWYRRMEKIRS